MKKTIITKGIISLLLIGSLLTGEILCIYKSFRCNWEPIGKAEIIYTACAFTPLGPIVGYFDIKDK